jgi:hypothetical protein
MSKQKKGRVLMSGQCYYNGWYLTRELRRLGWRADQLNYDSTPSNANYYHGEDIKFSNGFYEWPKQLWFYFKVFFNYDIIHFSNRENFTISPLLSSFLKRIRLPYLEIRLLKRFNKKIFYTNNGCLDGVSQSSFSTWGPEKICDICVWKNNFAVCNDKRNLAWGKTRNEIADLQCLLGGNRIDYNLTSRAFEVPWFYCLDKSIWDPDLLVPANFRLPFGEDTIKIYHSVGDYDSRSNNRVTIKSTHIYIDVVDRLKNDGYNVELIFFKNIPNKDLRYYQIQSDIVVDMLTYGFFGANVREALMLGKPVICFLRPEWLESMKLEIPEYVDELPIISATPDTVYEILKRLINERDKRIEIGRKSREFAIKWHGSEVAAQYFKRLYSAALTDDLSKKTVNRLTKQFVLEQV